MAVSGIEYDQLSKIQWLAMLLIVVGPEAAGQILKNFEDTEIEMVCKEINRWSHVPRDLQEKILDEFSEIIGDSLKESVGGYRFAKEALEIARGDYKANTMLNRIEPGRSATNLMDGVDKLNARQIYSLISREQGQTIAFVIANLSKVGNNVNAASKRREAMEQQWADEAEACMQLFDAFRGMRDGNTWWCH